MSVSLKDVLDRALAAAGRQLAEKIWRDRNALANYCDGGPLPEGWDAVPLWAFVAQERAKRTRQASKESGQKGRRDMRSREELIRGLAPLAEENVPRFQATMSFAILEALLDLRDLLERIQVYYVLPEGSPKVAVPGPEEVPREAALAGAAYITAHKAPLADLLVHEHCLSHMTHGDTIQVQTILAEVASALECYATEGV